MQFDSDYKEKADEGSEVIYKDEDYYVFLKCLDRYCLTYYTPEKIYNKVSEHFRERDNNVFFIVDKNSDKTVITTILQSPDKTLFFRNNNSTTYKDVIGEYTFLAKEISSIYFVSNTLDALLKIQNGFEYDSYQLRNLDENIFSIRFNEKNPAKSIIELSFDKEDYLKMFYDDSEEYNAEFIMQFIGSIYYYDFYFNDIDSIYQDFREGYIMRNFDAENWNKLRKIASYLNPKVKDESEDELSTEMSNLLLHSFEGNVDNICQKYHEMDEECKRESLVKSVYDEFCDALEPFGIFRKSTNCFHRYVTSVNVLLSLYKRYDNNNLSIKQLLKYLISSNNLQGYSYSDNYYEFYCVNWDDKEFNKTVSYELDDIIEKIEEGQHFSDIEKYKKLLNILKDYHIRRLYPVPATPKEKSFVILDIDPEENKLKVAVHKKDKPIEIRKYTAEEFYTFLNSPEIFD